MEEKRQRSPNYPSIPLSKAIDLANELYGQDKMSYVNLINLGYAHMNLSPTSNSQRIISTMLDYGILEDQGEGSAKEIRITELGRNIILDTRQESDERTQNLRIAVLKSPLMRKIWNNWHRNLPAQDSIKYTLRTKMDFTERASDRLCNVIKQNYSFANLYEYHEIAENPGDEDDDDDAGESGKSHEGATPEFEKMGKHINENWIDFSLSLGANQKARLQISNKLSEDDFEFLITWIKRLQKDIIEETNEEDIPF